MDPHAGLGGRQSRVRHIGCTSCGAAPCSGGVSASCRASTPSVRGIGTIFLDAGLEQDVLSDARRFLSTEGDYNKYGPPLQA